MEWAKKIAISVMVIAVGARLWGFLTAGPLWLDELFIATNLRALSFAELLGPLLEGQNAPVGWLWLEKTIWELTSAQGTAPHAAFLRLPALLSSLLALPLVWGISRRTLDSKVAWVPLLLLAISPFAVWQSFQVKPYAFDLWAAALLMWLALRVLEAPAKSAESESSSGLSRAMRMATLAAAGALLVWFSLPAIFVLAGLGSVLFWQAWHLKARLIPIIAIGALWLGSFGAHHLLFMRRRERPEWLFDFWSSGLLAWPPGSWDVLWLPRVLSSSLEDPVGFVHLGPVAAFFLAAGAVLLIRRVAPFRRGDGPAPEPERLKTPGTIGLLLVASPILFALLASGLRLYPFSSRLILFLLPSLTVLATFGWHGAARRWPRASIATAILALVIPAALFLRWLPQAGLPIAAQSVRLFEELSQNHRPGEPVVLAHLATYAWKHYAVPLEAPIVETPSAWLDEDRARALEETLEATAAPAVWVVLTRVRNSSREPDPYTAFVDSQSTWPSVDLFSSRIEKRWRIDAERHVYGGVLWRLERKDVQAGSKPGS